MMIVEEGDITPSPTYSEPLHQTSWGHGSYNMVSQKSCNTQTPRPSQEGTPCQSRVVEDDCKYLGLGICPWLSD
eukprot:11336324-Karenia_brevis.AAC.1